MAKSRSSSAWRTIWGWFWPIAIGTVIAKIIMTWVFSFAEVPSGSMYPTIPNPCRILVDHVATEIAKPYRGEVVLFHFPDDPSRIFVKRIIGMPGDTVNIRDNHVYINNQALNEPYLKVQTTGDFGPYHVPADSYFMMGDNRGISDDSRFWIHPYVRQTAIVGRADLVIWPFNAFGRIQ